MIGFILGTSEGKKIISIMNHYTDNIAVSTATNYGGQLLKDFRIKELNTKPLEKHELLEWIKKNNIRVLIDGSHPYAQEVTKNAMECADELNIDYIRYERPGILEKIESDNIIRVRDYDEAIEYLKNFKGNILNTTGGNNASRFLNIDFKYRVINRILPSVPVMTKLINNGVNVNDIVAIQGPVSSELEIGFIKHFNIKGILTKDSGIEGGCLEKYEAAKKMNIKLIVIEKPNIDYKLQFNSPESLIEYLIEKYRELF